MLLKIITLNDMIKTNKKLTKKKSKLNKNLKEDLEFARRTKEAYKRHERGKFKSMDAKDFLKELKKW